MSLRTHSFTTKEVASWIYKDKSPYWFPWFDLVLGSVSVAFRGGMNALLELVGAAAAQAAVSLRAAAVNGLHQEPVDEFIELWHIWGHGPHLPTLWSSEHILVQRTPVERHAW